MKKVKTILTLLVAISVMGIGLCYAKPKIHKDDITADIPPDVKREIEGLYPKDPSVRADSIVRLGQMGVQAVPAIPFLIDMLGDRDKWRSIDLRSSVAKGKEEVFKVLFSTSGTVGETAAEALAKIGKPAVEPLIATALDDMDGISTSNAALALKLMNDTSVIETLIVTLKRGKSPVVLQRYLTPKEVRNKAEVILKHIGNPAVEPLIAEMKNEDYNIRRRVASIIGYIADPRAVEPLITALNDENINVQRVAAESLGRIRDPRAVEPLIRVLTEESLYIVMPMSSAESRIVVGKKYKGSVRWAAAKALGEIKDPRAIEPLITALSEKDINLHMFAAGALREMTGRDFGTDYSKWQEWWEQKKEEFLKSK